MGTAEGTGMVYSQRQTSAITTICGTACLMASTADCTGPDGSHDDEPMASFDSGSPNSNTARMPASNARSDSSTASRTRLCQTPGIDRISTCGRLSGTTNSG